MNTQPIIPHSPSPGIPLHSPRRNDPEGQSRPVDPGLPPYLSPRSPSPGKMACHCPESRSPERTGLRPQQPASIPPSEKMTIHEQTGMPVKIVSPVPCDNEDCMVCPPRDRSQSPVVMKPPPRAQLRRPPVAVRPPPMRASAPPIPTVVATPPMPTVVATPVEEKDKIMQGYIFLGKLQAYVDKRVKEAVDPLVARLSEVNGVKSDLEEVVRQNESRIEALERMVSDVSSSLRDALEGQSSVVRRQDSLTTDLTREESLRLEMTATLSERVEALESKVETMEETMEGGDESKEDFDDSRIVELEEWRQSFEEEQARKLERMDLVLGRLSLAPDYYSKADVDHMLREKVDATYIETMKSHIKTTLTEFDRMVKQALDSKCDKVSVEAECARIWQSLHDLIQKVERKIIKKYESIDEAMEKKADKTAIYPKEVVDAKLQDKLDVPFGELQGYEVSFIPEETFAVDMLPERVVAIPVPDTIPSKATHVQMSIQFHLTDHVSMCQFSMSTFRNAGKMDDNTQVIRVSWLSDALREVLWTFRVNGRYGRTLFAKWTDDRPQWQMVREWVSHYSCRAIVKAVAWEVYDDENVPIASIPAPGVDRRLSEWNANKSDEKKKKTDGAVETQATKGQRIEIPNDTVDSWDVPESPKKISFAPQMRRSGFDPIAEENSDSDTNDTFAPTKRGLVFDTYDMDGDSSVFALG